MLKVRLKKYIGLWGLIRRILTQTILCMNSRFYLFIKILLMTANLFVKYSSEIFFSNFLSSSLVHKSIITIPKAILKFIAFFS